MHEFTRPRDNPPRQKKEGRKKERKGKKGDLLTFTVYHFLSETMEQMLGMLSLLLIEPAGEGMRGDLFCAGYSCS